MPIAAEETLKFTGIPRSGTGGQTYTNSADEFNESRGRYPTEGRPDRAPRPCDPETIGPRKKERPLPPDPKVKILRNKRNNMKEKHERIIE